MTQTRRISQAADAILVLINSRPRSPTRKEIVSTLAKLQPEADNDNTPPAENLLLPVRVSDLGRNLLELLPARGEAQHYDVHDYESDLDACNEAVDRAVEAILDAPAEEHLGDLAIAVRCLTVEGCYGNHLCEAARAAIVRVLLKAAGIDEEACDQDALYRAAERRIGSLVEG
jgi:hypothetical protein